MALFVFDSNTSGHYSYSNRIVLSSPGTIRIRIEYLWPLVVFASNTYLTKNHYSYSLRIPLATIRIRFEYVSHPKPLFVFASNTSGHYSYSLRMYISHPKPLFVFASNTSGQYNYSYSLGI